MAFAQTLLVAVATLTSLLPAAGARHDPTVTGCDNDKLLRHPGLIVVVPHPDDGALGFAGLLHAYVKADRPTTLVVVTNGDAACGACRFWANAGRDGPACSPADLDAFGQARVEETREAMALLGKPRLRFLGYPDGGIAAASKDLASGHPQAVLLRRDCRAGQAGVPSTLTAESLAAALQQLLAAAAPGTLIATTDPMAGHPDHAALGQLVARANAALPEPHRLIFGLIHTPPADGTECTYPLPGAVDCACQERSPQYFLSKPGLLDQLRGARYHPDQPASAPPHFSGAPLQLCEPPELWQGAAPLKLQAINRFRTQIGTASRDGTPIPSAERGWSDCTGYLTAFVRRTELFWPAPSSVLASSGRR